MRYMAVLLILFGVFIVMPEVTMENDADALPAPVEISRATLPDTAPGVAEVNLPAFEVAADLPDRLADLTPAARLVGKPLAAIRSWATVPVEPADIPAPDQAPAVTKTAVLDIWSTLAAAPVVRAPPSPAPVATDATETAERPVEPDAAPENDDVRLVTASVLNMREGPSTKFDVVKPLENGDAAVILGETERGWIKVRVAGEEGWVFARYLSPDGEA